MNLKYFLKKNFPFLAYYLLKKQKPFLTERNKIFNYLGIDLVLDVGANIGLYAHQIRNLGFKGKIFSFEPLSDAFINLESLSAKDDKWEVFNLAIGEKNGELDLNVTNNSVSSSFLGLNSNSNIILPEIQYVKTQKAEMMTLEKILNEKCSNFKNIYLKLDTQGYEMRILESSKDILNRVKAVQLETQLIKMYEDSADFTNIFEFMKSVNFRPASFEPGWSHKDTGLMVELDVIFLKND